MVQQLPFLCSVCVVYDVFVWRWCYINLFIIKIYYYYYCSSVCWVGNELCWLVYSQRSSWFTHKKLKDHTHTHPFNGPFPGLPKWACTRKVKTNLDFTEARDSEWQWHQLGCMQVCTSIQTDNHAITPPLSFLQAGCPSCHPTNSVQALKAQET